MKNREAIHPSELVPFTSMASAILLLVLVCLQMGTGVTQQFFESVRDPMIYAQRLVDSESWFRIIAGVDDVFLIFYSTSAVLLALSVRERSGGLWILVLAGGLGAGLLDAAENHHMLAMLDAAKLGITPAISELTQRAVFSSLKWIIGHLAFFILAFTLRAETIMEKGFRFALIFVQAPVGIAALVAIDPMMVKTFGLLRLLNVMLGFATIGLLFRRQKSGTTFSAPSASGVLGSSARA